MGKRKKERKNESKHVSLIQNIKEIVHNLMCPNIQLFGSLKKSIDNKGEADSANKCAAVDNRTFASCLFKTHIVDSKQSFRNIMPNILHSSIDHRLTPPLLIF